MIIIASVLFLLCGFVIGIFWNFIYRGIYNRKLRKNAIKVLKGEKENTIEIGGRLINVNKFIVKDEMNNKKMITLCENGK